MTKSFFSMLVATVAAAAVLHAGQGASRAAAVPPRFTEAAPGVWKATAHAGRLLLAAGALQRLGDGEEALGSPLWGASGRVT